MKFFDKSLILINLRIIPSKLGIKFFEKPSSIKFEDKVRSMTGKEIVMAMVNGLLHGYYIVNMYSYGGHHGKICYGCAATRCITEISKVKFNSSNIYGFTKKSEAIGCSPEFINEFEDAINFLRSGRIQGYNRHAINLGIVTLPDPKNKLPVLENRSWKENIQAYIDYANTID